MGLVLPEVCSRNLYLVLSKLIFFHLVLELQNYLQPQLWLGAGYTVAISCVICRKSLVRFHVHSVEATADTKAISHFDLQANHA
jgi:hypothetical protein